MRILVTDKGNIVLKSIEINSPQKKYDTKQVSIETTKSDDIHSKSIKSVNINIKKPFIIRSDLYNSNETDTRNNIIQTSNFEFDNLKKSVTLKDIIPEEKISIMIDKKVQNTIISSELDKNHVSKFRKSPPTKRDIISNINEITNKNISTDKVNLITYLNNKSEISPTFLKKLSQYDENRLKLVNKISQRLLYNEEKYHIMNSIIEEKIKFKRFDKINGYKEIMNEAQEKIDGINKLSTKHKYFNNKEVYKMIHQDIENRYWNKYNINRLNILNNRRATEASSYVVESTNNS